MKRPYRQKGVTIELNSTPNMQETQLYDQLTKIELLIHSKLSQARRLKRINYLCEHTNTIKPQQPSTKHRQETSDTPSEYDTLVLPAQLKAYNQSINYYDLFWKLFLINQNTACKVNRLYDNVEEMLRKRREIQRLMKDREGLIRDSEAIWMEKVKKKKRVKAKKQGQTQEPTKVSCPYPSCYKDYYSQISLHLHMRLKHNGGNKSQRQYYAETIWRCREQRMQEPVMPINFAPGYLEEYGMLTGRVGEEVYEKERRQKGWKEGQVDRKVVDRGGGGEGEREGGSGVGVGEEGEGERGENDMDEEGERVRKD